MIRPKLAASFAILGGLVGPSFAVGQDPARSDKPVIENVTPQGTVRIFEGKPLHVQSSKPYTVMRSTQGKNANVSVMRRTTKLTADPLQAALGLSIAPPDDTLRSQLDIPAGQGVVVTGVTPKGLADQAGLKLNDVLLSLGDAKALSVDQARNVILAAGNAAIPVKLIREGKPRELNLVGPEHGAGHVPSEYWIGVPASPVDATLRSHLAELPSGAGLIANDVVVGSPAEKAGLKKNDILITLSGKPVKSSEELVKLVQATEGKPSPLEVFRGGKPVTLTITPGKRTVAESALHSGPFDVFYSYSVPGVSVTGPGPGTLELKSDGTPGHETLSLTTNGAVNRLDGGAVQLRIAGDQLANTNINPQIEAIVKDLEITLKRQLADEKVTKADVNARLEAAVKEIKESVEALKKAVEAIEKK